MRRRSVLLLASGVLAVGGIVLPSIGEQQSSGSTRITHVVVNEGQPVVLKGTDATTVTFAITAEDKSGIRSVDKIGVWGSNYGVLRPTPAPCVAKSRTVSVCTGSFTVDLAKHDIYDNMAGQWYVQATATANDGDRFESDTAGKFFIKKDGYATLTGTQSSATAGTVLDIEGQLMQPDWKTGLWAWNPGQPVQLRFKAAGGSTWQTVARTRTDSHGYMRAETKATTTGTYAWYYAGKDWSVPVTSTAAQVSVG
ncbi:hypothetical protein [Streptacidiphilus jiangxiensis]|uniref:Calcium-binding protein n=1 Tax=Streptacidiphilus jiangxiensis TaxID=235985 RepID=A0A1H7SMB3_STRJI|nr:hypothetical protein [Streptacidiphilus jiangxiensis]SEL73256.1 hypothetical protein SAMN05414137_11278 [Streptacidiphilus jiangxiensis]